MDDLLSFHDDEHFLPSDSRNPNRNDGVVIIPQTSVSSASASLPAIEMSPVIASSATARRPGGQDEDGDFGHGSIERGTDTGVPASQRQNPLDVDLPGDLIDF